MYKNLAVKTALLILMLTISMSSFAITSQKKQPNYRIGDLEKTFNKITNSQWRFPFLKNWGRHIYIGGFLNTDLQAESKPNFTDHNTTNIELSTVKVSIDAYLNRWIKAYTGLFYASNSYHYYPTETASGVKVTEAYVVVANFRKSPFYLKLGRQYPPFGNTRHFYYQGDKAYSPYESYQRYPILKSFTQQLSELKATALQAGFVEKHGLYGATYIFSGKAKTTDRRHDKLNNFGFELGIAKIIHTIGFDLGTSYVHNMSDIGEISYNVWSYYYAKRVGVWTTYVDIKRKPFHLALHYVTALRNFSPDDLQYRINSSRSKGARPAAFIIRGSYAFKAFGHYGKVGADYQRSYESYTYSRDGDGNMINGMQLPKTRISLAYGVQLMKPLLLYFEYARDHDYSKSHGGTNAYDNYLTARVTLFF